MESTTPHPMVQWLGKVFLWMLGGWRAVVKIEMPEKCICVVAHHTTNWDFPIALACRFAMGFEFNYFGKHTLFKGPLGPLFYWWGGIPVNRKAPGSLIETMVQECQKRSVFRLGLAPEGTRQRAKGWKSGFYRMAMAAEIPVVLGFINRRTKEVGIGGIVHLSGDRAADMKKIADFYQDVHGIKRENESPVVLLERGNQTADHRAEG